MKTDYGFPDKGTIWFTVILIVLVATLIILVTIWGDKITTQSIELENTNARCKSAGGEMGFSKCYKDGKEI